MWKSATKEEEERPRICRDSLLQLLIRAIFPFIYTTVEGSAGIASKNRECGYCARREDDAIRRDPDGASCEKTKDEMCEYTMQKDEMCEYATQKDEERGLQARDAEETTNF